MAGEPVWAARSLSNAFSRLDAARGLKPFLPAQALKNSKSLVKVPIRTAISRLDTGTAN
ncbi:unnamed protein product [Ectocarpus sp. CCAP 1310/34]|nr:unnamed protein product [Ectocarpus sp. CCAP 1310/34]